MLERIAALGQMFERFQRMLVSGHRLPIRRSLDPLGASLAEIGHRLLPALAAEGVVGEPVNLFGQPVGVERLHGFQDPGMKRAASLL